MLLLGMLNILKLRMCSHPMTQALKERPGPLRVGYLMPHPVCLRAQVTLSQLFLWRELGKLFLGEYMAKPATFELFHEDPRDTACHPYVKACQ